MKVVEHRFGEATAVWTETGSRIQTNPFAYGLAQQVDCQVQIEKTVPGKIENCANSVARIGGDSNALVRARFLAFQQRVAQTEPNRTGTLEEDATRDPDVHQGLRCLAAIIASKHEVIIALITSRGVPVSRYCPL